MFKGSENKRTVTMYFFDRGRQKQRQWTTILRLFSRREGQKAGLPKKKSPKGLPEKRAAFCYCFNLDYEEQFFDSRNCMLKKQATLNITWKPWKSCDFVLLVGDVEIPGIPWNPCENPPVQATPLKSACFFVDSIYQRSIIRVDLHTVSMECLGSRLCEIQVRVHRATVQYSK